MIRVFISNAPPLAMIEKKFFDTVKSAALTAIWSQGVQISRALGVSLEEESDDELVFRVQSKLEKIAPLVVLYPGDGEWTCDCGDERDTCACLLYTSPSPRDS